MPNHCHRAALFFGWEYIGDFRGGWISEAMQLHIVTGSFGVNRFRGIQVQRPESRIDHMTKPIADRARAEVKPTAPLHGNPKRAVRAKRHRADPKLVVKLLGNI